MTDYTIKPEWRTSTVLGLCRSMRETQTFDALPILADALQDADCDDEELLARLRSGFVGYVEDTRLIALVLTPEAAESVEWLETLAAELGDSHGYDDEDGGIRQPMNYGVLMGAAKEHAADGEYMTQYGSEYWRTTMHNKYEEFWRHYQLVTGTTVKDPEASFFSCSC